jgi:predicted ATP-grasp superfamily ATP-dependent carboligase
MNNIKKILVTDGNSRAALAITRSLGSKGYCIYVGERVKRSLSSSSKYCYKSVLYPDPVSEYQDFCETIKQIVKESQIDLVIPVTDVCVFPITKMGEDGELGCQSPLVNNETMRLAADKSELIKLSQQLGIAVPLSQTLEKKTDLNLDALEIPFPVVIKPSRSRVMIDGKWIFTSVSYAKDKDELLDILNNTDKQLYPIILQERVSGKGLGAFYCYDNGVCTAKFSHRRIREKPPSGGVSVLRESVQIDPIVDEQSQSLLSQLNWHGVAMVEYKYDQKNNIPYFMEVNGRFWGSLQLAIDAGVDFPNMLVNIMQKRQVEYTEEYKIGVKTRWLWGDIDLLMMLLFKSKKQLNLPDDYGPRWKVVVSILNPFGKRMYYEVLKVRDLKPWLYETKQWFREMVK